MNHLNDVITVYKEPHPEVSEPLEKALEVMSIMDDIIDKVERSL